jgi:hypothetical protein
VAIEAERGVSFARDDGLRFANRDALSPLFDQAIGARTHADLAAVLDSGGVVHSTYRTMLDDARDRSWSRTTRFSARWRTRAAFFIRRQVRLRRLRRWSGIHRVRLPATASIPNKFSTNAFRFPRAKSPA